MQIEITQEDVGALEDYSAVPIAFEVARVLALDRANLRGISLSEHSVRVPYLKDNDGGDIHHARGWGQIWSVANWGVLRASVDGVRVGGAVIAYDSDGVDMLERRKDLAVLWDLRVHPDFRRSGVGSALFAQVLAWTNQRACTQLKIETQNTNVPACKFFQGKGCELGAINAQAYGVQSSEIQMLWYLELNTKRPARPSAAITNPHSGSWSRFLTRLKG